MFYAYFLLDDCPKEEFRQGIYMTLTVLKDALKAMEHLNPRKKETLSPQEKLELSARRARERAIELRGEDLKGLRENLKKMFDSAIQMEKLQEELWYLAGNSEFLIKDLFLALKAYEAVLDRTESGLRSSRDDIFTDCLVYEHVINLLQLLQDLINRHGDVKIFGDLPKE